MVYTGNKEINHEIELAWLAGIMDGEGYIGVKFIDGKKKHPVVKHARRGLGTSIYIRIKLETVSKIMIDRVTEILDKNGVLYTRGKPEMKKLSTIPSLHIMISRKAHVLRFCELIIDYSVVKKYELSLIMQYLRKSVQYVYYRMTQADLDLLAKMSKLHDMNGKKGVRKDYGNKFDNIVEQGNLDKIVESNRSLQYGMFN